MISVKIIVAAGPHLGTDDIVKKLPDNMTVGTLKNIFSKMFNIAAD